MSILKSILHRWNKDSKSYDTLHPETEVAQIPDFADGIVNKLAATTAISAISALQTDSWFGKMMKWVLDASGVKYLIDTNGYVCFGSLFGGLIIQWGRAVLPIDGKAHTVPLPTMVDKIGVGLVSMLSPDVPDIVMAPYWTNADATNIYITTDYETGHSYNGTGQNIVAWVLISG